MKRSTSKKILTTHVGSLPRPDGTDLAGGEDEATLRKMVAGVVARQREAGIDVINEGEYAKGGDWLSYVDSRFDGFEARPPAGGKPLILQGKDREEFADFYKYASERGTLFFEPDQAVAAALGRGRADQISRRRCIAERDRHLPRRHRPGHRGVYHHDRAREPRAVPAQRILQERRGVCFRDR